jgi:hypothetical protein
MVVAKAAHVRLALVDGLRGMTTVILAGVDPLRTLRASRPDVVLVAVRRRDRQRSLTLARSLRTDGRQPPLVGLVDPGSVLADPQQAMVQVDAGGCLVGRVDRDRIRALLSALRGGERLVLRE